jgi:hypothetical protein
VPLWGFAPAPKDEDRSFQTLNQYDTFLVMKAARQTKHQDLAIARTIRFPKALRERISADAERCNRSFESQVIAVLRRHYGEDVDSLLNPMQFLN